MHIRFLLLGLWKLDLDAQVHILCKTSKVLKSLLIFATRASTICEIYVMCIFHLFSEHPRSGKSTFCEYLFYLFTFFKIYLLYFTRVFGKAILYFHIVKSALCTYLICFRRFYCTCRIFSFLLPCIDSIQNLENLLHAQGQSIFVRLIRTFAKLMRIKGEIWACNNEIVTDICVLKTWLLTSM